MDIKLRQCEISSTGYGIVVTVECEGQIYRQERSFIPEAEDMYGAVADIRFMLQDIFKDMSGGYA